MFPVHNAVHCIHSKEFWLFFFFFLQSYTHTRALLTRRRQQPVYIRGPVNCFCKHETMDSSWLTACGYTNGRFIRAHTHTNTTYTAFLLIWVYIDSLGILPFFFSLFSSFFFLMPIYMHSCLLVRFKLSILYTFFFFSFSLLLSFTNLLENTHFMHIIYIHALEFQFCDFTGRQELPLSIHLKYIVQSQFILVIFFFYLQIFSLVNYF